MPVLLLLLMFGLAVSGEESLPCDDIFEGAWFDGTVALDASENTLQAVLSYVQHNGTYYEYSVSPEYYETGHWKAKEQRPLVGPGVGNVVARIFDGGKWGAPAATPAVWTLYTPQLAAGLTLDDGGAAAVSLLRANHSHCLQMLQTVQREFSQRGVHVGILPSSICDQ